MTPGEDGFTVEFYKFFFELLGHNLVESFNGAHEANELSISQRRGIIAFIPKEDCSLLDLSNWQRITLLNVDCKIATKAIAKRIEALLPKLINSDQTSFIKGLIIDIMEYTKTHNIPGILVSLDFRKAFDSLEWPFIMRTLDVFNFGTSIQKWVSTFYANIESAAFNKGFLTNRFRLSRGVHQGCPLSLYLFILSAEVMANKIQQDQHIKGIEILGNKLRLSQYADDRNLFCADLASVNFGSLAGLKLNWKKTKALFWRVLIIKSFALSQVVYSASNLNVPQEITPIIKPKLFQFLWKNKKDKIKREALYQDRDKGGIRMIDIETMIKALRLAWIPRLFTPGTKNWKTIPDYYLGRYGGLSFLLR